MNPLNPDYQKKLDAIAAEIQESEAFKTFLDTEEEEDYIAFRDIYEAQVAAVHKEVADNHPLQLIAFEKAMINTQLEGMFYPRILGYSVLRGVINEHYKYRQPQDHFKEILLSICNSSNFDFIRKRIGQTVQVGFALSSDIWVTNLVNELTNKKIKYFLQSQKLPRFRDIRDRKLGYHRYQNQFKKENYYSTIFPATKSQLATHYPSVEQFVIQRVELGIDNSDFVPDILQFLETDIFKGTNEHLRLSIIVANFMNLADGGQKKLGTIIDEARKSIAEYDEKWLTVLLELHESKIAVDKKADRNVSETIDKSIDDDLSSYYNLTDKIHTKGYLEDEVITAIRDYYNNYEGLSINNECLRKTIYNYFHQVLANIEPEEYTQYFELSKIFPIYMDIFNNQSFNQSLKELCLAYVKKLIKRYTDKRGKDYQDIKKFVTSTFREYKFMKDKELVELFKTRRKKKPTA